MTLKSDAKFNGEPTCGLKNDIKNLVNFHASSRKSENLHFDGRLLYKAYKYLDEKVKKKYVSSTLKCDTKFKQKLTLGSINDMRNLVNFNSSSGKTENLNFDGLLL